MKVRQFFLKSVPYILSILGGIAVYVVSVGMIDSDMEGLLSNIAASLLAIPLVFILYDYVDWKMSSSLNDKMAESLIFDVNSILLNVLKTLRQILAPKQSLSWKMIEKMLRMRSREIHIKAKFNDKNIELLKSYKKSLNELSYKLVRSGILSDRQIQRVISVTKQLAHVVNEWEYMGNTSQLSKYMQELLDAVDDWFDACEREALYSHQQFQLAIEQEGRNIAK